jgi:hypothetical protein
VIWWLVIALVAGSLILLAVAAAVLLRHLTRLGIAARQLQFRLTEARRLEPAMTALQERAEQMQQEVGAIQERAALLRGHGSPSRTVDKPTTG